MAAYSYPTTIELEQIAQQKMPRLIQDREPFKWFPIEEKDEYMLVWEQLDNFIGLQQVRGLNGEPPRVRPVGLRQYTMQPGVYGEFIPIDEAEMTTRRQTGTFGTAIDVQDLVLIRQDQLLSRRLDRIEQIIWLLITTGTFSVPGPNGAILHTDSFTLQTFTAVVPWATPLTSTPLQNFSSVQLLSRGYSVNFGAAAVAYMNRQTFNDLRSNANPVDLYGRRTKGFGTINNQEGINQLLTGDDLPTVVVYDEGYLDDNGIFQPFIPYGKVVVIGKRPAGQKIGAYRTVRNANNEAMKPGPYMRVIDKGEQLVPRTLEVHDGHNGGVVLYYGSAIVVMNV